MKKNYRNYFLISYFVLSCVLLLYYYPRHILIADEVSYIFQSFNILGKTYSPVFHPANYPLGTAFFYSAGAILFSYKYLLLFNVLILCFSTYLVEKSCKCPTTALFLLLSPILVFSTRLVLSELPSYFLVCVFIYFYSRPPTKKNNFILFFIYGLSFFVREANIITLFPLCVYRLISNRLDLKLCLFGFITGLLPRFLSSYFYFGSFLSFKEPMKFELLNAVKDSHIFFPSTLFTCFILNKEKKVFIIAILLHIFFYSLYEYRGDSGNYMNSLFLVGRFFIPIIPLAVVLVDSELIVNYLEKFKSIPIYFLSFVLSIFIHSISSVKEEAKYKSIDALISKYDNEKLNISGYHAESFKLYGIDYYLDNNNEVANKSIVVFRNVLKPISYAVDKTETLDSLSIDNGYILIIKGNINTLIKN
jgi:hypothetical protein